ncbi:abortive phage resistance protein [Enterobacter hormaechei]|uniref:AbiTii domain-containing protein n=1 Tax=Enterobacteriaceae TaxID=543 RepID=UPI002706CADB|nr:abortive phage resistance protein [Escherichia coli]MDO2645474.1 abortive phage resistance protein [Escherichia coli]MDO2669820.1 abortive phage resistance protein [Escherichia coli]WQJ94012.1 abortive phage resistance protein [Enterobacter hormaechei]
MQNSPVIQLRQMIHADSYGMSSILMQSIIIARKIGDKEFGDWLEYEYRGYPSKALTPVYRLFDLPHYAQLHDGSWQPMNLDRTFLKDILEHDNFNLFKMCAVQNPIADIERMASSDEPITAFLSEKQKQFFSNLFGNFKNYAQFPHRSHMVKIILDVKMMILNWALELEEKGVLCENLSITQQQREIMTVTVNNNTNNFHAPVNNAGTIVAGSTGNIKQANKITAGDFNSLKEQLKQWGATDEDIEALHQAIQESTPPTSSDAFGGKIGKWVGDMIGKAYAGTLNIAASAAPALLTNAICNYYNIPV